MNWPAILLGFLAAAFLLEGLFPLLFPDFFRRRLAQMAEMTPGQLRFVGLTLCGTGAALALAAVIVARG